MAKNRNVAESDRKLFALFALTKELGFPDDVAAELVPVALKMGDPEDYLRRVKAENDALRAEDEPKVNGDGEPKKLEPEKTVPGEEACKCDDDQPPPEVKTSLWENRVIAHVPVATRVHGREITASWPYRIGHVSLQLGVAEGHLKDALCRLFYGLQESGARLKGSNPEIPPRPITSQADALRWLLEQIAT